MSEDDSTSGSRTTGGRGSDTETGAEPDPDTEGAPAGMVPITGGSYSNDFGSHVIEDFFLDQYEVTVGEYQDCVEGGGCTPAGADAQCTSPAGDDDLPINCVGALQADAYCAWLDRRLPTEWEWEWAARGGMAGTTYPWGDAPDPSCSHCVMHDGGFSCGNAVLLPRPIGFTPEGDSPDGVSDLSGNVWEWTASWLDEEETQRVLRGGGWGETNGDTMAAAYRNSQVVGHVVPDYGFRCAMDGA